MTSTSERETVARRLLDSSEQLSYDPVKEVDWATPLATGSHGEGREVMRRDWLRDERGVPVVRTINYTHVVEESRHMKFAREETRERLRGTGRLRRQLSALVVAIASYFIVTSMVNAQVYENAGLDGKRARREAKANEHHKSMLRSSCSGLM